MRGYPFFLLPLPPPSLPRVSDTADVIISELGWPTADARVFVSTHVQLHYAILATGAVGQ